MPRSAASYLARSPAPAAAAGRSDGRATAPVDEGETRAAAIAAQRKSRASSSRTARFYDYDELAYLTGCNYREIPPARTPQHETASKPWCAVGSNDVFPYPEALGFRHASDPDIPNQEKLS